MIEIQDDRIENTSKGFKAVCTCGKYFISKYKDSVLKMLKRGTCKHCFIHHKNLVEFEGIYKNSENKWCSSCYTCGKDQCYTRKDHAKQSHRNNTNCRKCTAELKSYSSNRPVGYKKRIFNRFKKSAKSRDLVWNLTIEDMFLNYTGYCALTNVELCLDYKKTTASLDRIDSSKGYLLDNIQWIHKDVNMMKNKYSQDYFISICKAVCNNINNNNNEEI